MLYCQFTTHTSTTAQKGVICSPFVSNYFGCGKKAPSSSSGKFLKELIASGLGRERKGAPTKGEGGSSALLYAIPLNSKSVH